MRTAIHGVLNSRFEDLPHMFKFTHTGELGIFLFIGICLLLYHQSFQRIIIHWEISTVVNVTNTGE